MPATAATSQSEKRATSVVHTRSAQPSPSPTAGGPNKVRTQSAADTSAQAKPSNDLAEARKTLSTFHLLPENAPCTAQTLACVLHTLAKSYKMSENIAKVISHVAELLHHIVTTPPMVGSTWPRVRSTLESDCLPALSQGTASFLSRCGLIDCRFHCHHAYPMSRDWGCISTSYRSSYVLPFVYAALGAILSPIIGSADMVLCIP